MKEIALKYFAYVRKSSEGEERQALSIDSQKDKVREFFPHLEIVEVLEEKRSAFKPYNRPVFADMVKRIERGEATGIIAWHPDRLSRNEIDASTITYLVRTGVIKDLKFGSYNFDNSPEGIMMLQMALSQSQYFSSKLGKDVRRGLEKKFEMGWQPNMCANGYLNVRNGGISTIEIDKPRFKILRKAFDLMLTGTYSVPEILDKLNNEWKFKPKHGGILARATLYRILTNIFYAGIIEYGGKQKLGKHEAMITLEEYDRIQLLLGRKGKPRKKTHDFAYTGVIHCGECACLVSADKKKKIIKKTGKPTEYTYYRCTHKKPSQKCLQPAVEVKELEKQIDDKLAQYDFNPKFREILFKMIDDDKKDNPDESKMIVANLEASIQKIKIEKSNLTKMSCKNLIPEEEFTEQRNQYELELVRLTQKIEEVKKQNGAKDEIIEDVKFALQARANFKNATLKDKKEILLRLGSNQTLRDRKLFIQEKKWLVKTVTMLKPLEQKFVTLELGKKPLTTHKSEHYNSLLCAMRRE